MIPCSKIGAADLSTGGPEVWFRGNSSPQVWGVSAQGVGASVRTRKNPVAPRAGTAPSRRKLR
jgi:hypothetical protein